MRQALVLLAGALYAQTGVFEVASIHASRPAEGEGRSRPSITTTPTGVTILHSNLRDAIEWAHRLRPFQLSGPGWIDTERYDIQARTTRGGDVRAMLQALLAERFRLEFHREPRQLLVYALVTAKGGPKLRESKLESSEWVKLPGGGLRLEFRRTSAAQLADFLSTLIAVDHPVRDRTGLAGAYDFRLDLHEMDEHGGPSVSTLLEEQLGLRFEARKEAVDLMVIDRVERPTQN